MVVVLLLVVGAVKYDGERPWALDEPPKRNEEGGDLAVEGMDEDEDEDVGEDEDEDEDEEGEDDEERPLALGGELNWGTAPRCIYKRGKQECN